MIVIVFVIAAQVAATSTTANDEQSSPRTLPSEVVDWTVEDVISYITSTDPNLGTYADLFRKHVREMNPSPLCL